MSIARMLLAIRLQHKLRGATEVNHAVSFDGRAMDIKKLDGNWLAGEV